MIVQIAALLTILWLCLIAAYLVPALDRVRARSGQ